MCWRVLYQNIWRAVAEYSSWVGQCRILICFLCSDLLRGSNSWINAVHILMGKKNLKWDLYDILILFSLIKIMVRKARLFWTLRLLRCSLWETSSTPLSFSISEYLNVLKWAQRDWGRAPNGPLESILGPYTFDGPCQPLGGICGVMSLVCNY